MSQEAETCSCQAREELASLTQKFENWQAKAKAGVEKQRHQIQLLQDEKITLDETISSLTRNLALKEESLTSLSQDAHDRDARLSGQLRSEKMEGERKTMMLDELTLRLQSVWSPYTVACPAMWLAIRELRTMAEASQKEVLTLRATASAKSSVGEQLASLQAEYTKYKERSNMTLQLTRDNVDELSQEVEAKTSEISKVQLLLQECQSVLSVKDRTIVALEQQLEEAAQEMLTLQTQLEEVRESHVAQVAHEHSVEVLHRSDDGTRNSAIDELQLQHNAEIEAINAQHQGEIQQLQAELVQGRMKLAALQSRLGSPKPKSGGNDDSYVATLLDQLSDAQHKLQQVQNENSKQISMIEKLNARVSFLDGSTKLGSSTTTTSIEELQRQLVVKSEQLWEANQQLLQLRAANARGARAGGATDGSIDGQQAKYLRAVLVKLLCAHSDGVRGSLLPVIATMLQMSTEDLREIYMANPEWRAA